MLFKRGKNTSRKYKPCGILFSFRKKNRPISLPPVLFRDLRKRINHGYQGTIHPLQLSVFSFFVFVCRLPTPEALLSQSPNPPKRTPDGEDPQQCRKKPTSGLVGHQEGITKLERNRYGVWPSEIVPEGQIRSPFIFCSSVDVISLPGRYLLSAF